MKIQIITTLAISLILFSCTKVEPDFLSESENSVVAKEKIMENSNESHVSISDIHSLVSNKI